MKKIMKTLSLLLAVGAMAFGSGLHHEETKVASAEGPYSYTFTSKQWSANGAKTLNGVSWTLAGNGGHWGYDNTKGHQFGSKNAPYKSMTLSTSGIQGTIDSIKIGTSGASSINATLTVLVGTTTYGTYKLTSSNTVKTFTGASTGEIKFSYTQSSSKAIYIKSIEILYTLSSSGPTDEEKITAVEDAIDAIGTVEYSDSCKKSIDAARSAYNALDEGLKNGVTNYATLTAAEARYEELKVEAEEAADKAAADAVITLLENLPEANEITDYSSASEVKAARNAYKALTDKQKNLVPDQLVDKLEAAEAKLEQYKPLMYEINTNGSLNNSAPELSSTAKLEEAYPTPDGISWTGTPSKAYGKLNTDALKLGTSKVAGYVELKLDSEEYYITEVIISANRYDSGTKLVITAGNLTVESGALAEGSNEYSFDVASAKSSTIKISTSPLRAYITGISVLYAKHTSNIDQAKVDEVIEIINNIGTPNASLTFKKDLEDAEAAFEALTPAEQEAVTNSSTLTSAREIFDSLVTSSKSFKGISSSYASTEITVADLKIDANIAGNNNSIGYNKVDTKEKAVTTENIAEALEIDPSTTGVVTLHTYFYDGFFSLDLFANDAIKGTVYYLGSADGGITYSVISSEELNVASGNPIDLDVSTSGITDLVIAFVSTQEAQRMDLRSVTYYSKANAENADVLLELLSELDTCTEYDEATTLREMYENDLTDYERIIFNRSNIADNDKDGKEISVNALEKLEYMEYLAGLEKQSEGLSSNLLSNITSSNNILIILVVGLLGLTSILGYYFLNKKKYAR